MKRWFSVWLPMVTWMLVGYPKISPVRTIHPGAAVVGIPPGSHPGVYENEVGLSWYIAESHFFKFLIEILFPLLV